MTPVWPSYKLARYDSYFDRLCAGLEHVPVPEGMVLSFVTTRVHLDASKVVTMLIPHLPDLGDHIIHSVVVMEYEKELLKEHSHGPPG